MGTSQKDTGIFLTGVLLAKPMGMGTPKPAEWENNPLNKLRTHESSLVHFSDFFAFYLWCVWGWGTQ